MRVKQTSLLTFLLAVSISALACNRNRTESKAPDKTEVIDQIFARYTEAIGGQEAIERVTTYKARGTFAISVAQMPGTFEAWGKNPNKSLTVIEFPNMGSLKKGFDGETNWVQTPVGIFSAKGATEMSEIERDAEVYRAGKIKNLYQDLKLENNARISGRDMWVIEGKPAKGPAEKLFFDKQNGLLVRWDMVRRNPQRGNVFVKVHLDDYREVDGVKVPHKVRFNFESFDFVMQIEELQHNIAVDDAMFKKPGGK